MSEAQEQYLEDGASAEDKFFGVKATFEKKKPKVEDEDSDVEIIDDRPPEDQRSPKAKSNDDDLDDEELGQYSEKVQKRLNKLKYEFHEERRQREAAERMREEAIRAAQQLANKNKEYESLVSRGEQALIEQVRERAQLSLNQAKEAYRKAYEEGDTDSILDSQEKLYRAQAELAEADKYRSSYSQNAQRYQQQQEELRRQEIARQAALSVAQQQQVQPQVSPEAQAWAEKNQWFMRQGYEEMTALRSAKGFSPTRLITLTTSITACVRLSRNTTGRMSGLMDVPRLRRPDRDPRRWWHPPVGAMVPNRAKCS